MKIGQAAGEAGVNIQTLRYYERRGLLTGVGRRRSGYREYDANVVEVVRFIRNAQELGFALAEIGELMDLRARRDRSQLEVRALASAKITEIDRRITQLESIREELSQLVDACVSADASQECVILDGIDCRSVVAPENDHVDH